MSLEDKDALLSDMASHQRMTGQEVTADKNDRLVVPVFERLAAKALAAKPYRKEQPRLDPTERHAQAKARAEKRAEETGRAPWQLKVIDESKPVKDVAAFGPATVELFQKLNRRIQLLLTCRDSGPLGAPSWRDRVLSVLAEKMTGRVKRQYTAHLIAVCEASNETFGDWKRDPAERLFFGSRTPSVG